MTLSTSVAVHYAGNSFDTNQNTFETVVVGNYALVDLRASYPLRENVEIYGRVENLADKRYETTALYGTLGRAGYGGVRLRF